jgi:hypothetical protein
MAFLVARYFSANFARFRCCRFVHQARRLARNDTPRVCLSGHRVAEIWPGPVFRNDPERWRCRQLLRLSGCADSRIGRPPSSRL